MRSGGAPATYPLTRQSLWCDGDGQPGGDLLGHNGGMTARYSPITLGKQIHTLSLRGLIVTESEHGGGISLPRHAHENASVVLIRKGTFTESIGQRSWDCKPGRAIYKPGGAEHADRFSSGRTETVLVELLPESVDRFEVAPSRLDGAVVLEDRRLQLLTDTLHHEMRLSDTSTPIAVEGVVLQILATLLRIQTPREKNMPAWLSRFRSALHDRACESLQISDLAHECGVHPAHAIREFRGRFGTTPADYLRRLRTERACEFLRRGMSPADAAAAAGFAHQSHFTRVLKRYYAVTPGEYLAMR